MTSTSVHEQRDIHAAVCRARHAGLACGTCSELTERTARRGWGRCPCGDEDWLIGGLCEPCRLSEAA